jgi:hypothetical protein
VGQERKAKKEEEMTEHVGVYKRGEVWWYRVGRGARFSSQSSDVRVAIGLREKALQMRRHSRATHAVVKYQRKLSEEWVGWVGDQRADSDSWLRRTLRHMRSKSKARQWVDCLDEAQLSDLMLESNGFCAITGLPFCRDTKAKRDPFSISIDRIDSANGYCAGNVRLVLLAVNLGMSHWGQEAFCRIARALVGRELVNASHNPLHSDYAGDIENSTKSL